MKNLDELNRNELYQIYKKDYDARGEIPPVVYPQGTREYYLNAVREMTPMRLTDPTLSDRGKLTWQVGSAYTWETPNTHANKIRELLPNAGYFVVANVLTSRDKLEEGIHAAMEHSYVSMSKLNIYAYSEEEEEEEDIEQYRDHEEDKPNCVIQAIDPDYQGPERYKDGLTISEIHAFAKKKKICIELYYPPDRMLKQPPAYICGYKSKKKFKLMLNNNHSYPLLPNNAKFAPITYKEKLTGRELEYYTHDTSERYFDVQEDGKLSPVHLIRPSDYTGKTEDDYNPDLYNAANIPTLLFRKMISVLHFQKLPQQWYAAFRQSLAQINRGAYDEENRILEVSHEVDNKSSYTSGHTSPYFKGYPNSGFYYSTEYNEQTALVILPHRPNLPYKYKYPLSELTNILPQPVYAQLLDILPNSLPTPLYYINAASWVSFSYLKYAEKNNIDKDTLRQFTGRLVSGGIDGDTITLPHYRTGSLQERTHVIGLIAKLREEGYKISIQDQEENEYRQFPRTCDDVIYSIKIKTSNRRKNYLQHYSYILAYSMNNIITLLHKSDPVAWNRDALFYDRPSQAPTMDKINDKGEVHYQLSDRDKGTSRKMRDEDINEPKFKSNDVYKDYLFPVRPLSDRPTYFPYNDVHNVEEVRTPPQIGKIPHITFIEAGGGIGKSYLASQYLNKYKDVMKVATACPTNKLVSSHKQYEPNYPVDNYHQIFGFAPCRQQSHPDYDIYHCDELNMMEWKHRKHIYKRTCIITLSESQNGCVSDLSKFDLKKEIEFIKKRRLGEIQIINANEIEGLPKRFTDDDTLNTMNELDNSIKEGRNLYIKQGKQFGTKKKENEEGKMYHSIALPPINIEEIDFDNDLIITGRHMEARDVYKWIRRKYPDYVIPFKDGVYRSIKEAKFRMRFDDEIPRAQEPALISTTHTYQGGCHKGGKVILINNFWGREKSNQIYTALSRVIDINQLRYLTYDAEAEAEVL